MAVIRQPTVPGRRPSLACRLLAGILPLALAGAAGAGSPAAREPSLVLLGGTFALVEAYDYPYSLGLQYRWPTFTKWLLEPGVGGSFGPDGMAFFYVDLQRDFALGAHWYLTPSFGGGYFANGADIGADYHVQFQTGLALSRRIANGWRWGLTVYHISNGGLSSPNNGTESLLLTFRIPAG